LSKPGDRERFLADASGYSVAGEGKHLVAISIELTPELVAEGTSRELVRYLQNMRRSAKLNITDHIITYYQTTDPLIKQVMNTFADYIKQETLSQELIDYSAPDGAYVETVRVSKGDVCLAIKRTDAKR
jgi:isoleucyl-tRNA synthetase